MTSTIRVSAPGKVILHGEHSVVYYKLAVAASLGLRTRLEYTEDVRKQNVELSFPSINLLHFFNLQDVRDLLATPLPLTTAPSMYNFTNPEFVDHEKTLLAVKSFIVEKSSPCNLGPQQNVALTSFLYLLWAFLGPLETDLCNFQLTVTSELTVSAGTGSSASFAVTLVAFLMQYIRVKKSKSKSPYKPFETRTNLETFDKNELELISKWAFHSEQIVHGTPSGVDNTICTFGGLVEFRKGTVPKLVALSTRFTTILVDTKVSRDTKRLVASVAERRQKYRLLIDGILEAMDVVTYEALECMKKINGGGGDFDVSEVYDSLGELTDMNHHLLGSLGVSHPKLNEICAVLEENGLRGKLTGAGGGGYAMCLVPPHFGKIEEVVEKLVSRGFDAVVTDLGGCGVTIDL